MQSQQQLKSLPLPQNQAQQHQPRPVNQLSLPVSRPHQNLLQLELQSQPQLKSLPIPQNLELKSHLLRNQPHRNPPRLLSQLNHLL